MNRLDASIAGAAALLLLVGCGASSGESSAGSEQSASAKVPVSASEALQEMSGVEPLTGPTDTATLEKRVAGYTAIPTELLVQQPLKSKPDADKTIAVVVTDVPIVVEFFNAIQEAAGELGWKVERIDQGSTPEEFAQAYDRAIELKPDLVVGSGLPREYFDKQLNELADMGIPVVEWSSGIKPVPDELWTALDDPMYEAKGLQVSEYLASDSDMKAQVVGFNVPQFAMPTTFLTSIKNYLPGICPDCSVDIQDAAVDNIGKLDVLVTAYIQQHPDTNYVVCGFGDLCTGVSAGLAAAGYNDVKVFTMDPATTNLQNIADGTEDGGTVLAIRQTGWQIIDLAARIFEGAATDGTRLAPQQIVTKVADPSDPNIGAVTDYQDKYRTMWQAN